MYPKDEERVWMMIETSLSCEERETIKKSSKFDISIKYDCF